MPKNKSGKRKRHGIYFSARAKRRRRRAIYAIFFLVFVILVTAYLLQAFGENKPSGEEHVKRAAILDGLSLDYPNSSFIDSAKRILEHAGFMVEVYSGDNVTLNLLQKLAAGDYRLIIFRVHGGRIRQPIGLFIGGGLFIERCSPDSHRKDIESGYILLGRPYFSNATYCVIPPHYILDKLRGDFKKTVIIAMSCFTGDDEVLADAFFKRGAEAYIGFKGKVSPPYIDAFTMRLLRKIYVEGLPLEDAFAEVKEELGSDPRYGGTPVLYLP